MCSGDAPISPTLVGGGEGSTRARLGWLGVAHPDTKDENVSGVPFVPSRSSLRGLDKGRGVDIDMSGVGWQVGSLVIEHGFDSTAKFAANTASVRSLKSRSRGGATCVTPPEETAGAPYTLTLTVHTHSLVHTDIGLRSSSVYGVAEGSQVGGEVIPGPLLLLGEKILRVGFTLHRV